MKAERPDVVLCIGQAGGRSAVTPERVAINVNDAGSPDNNGNQPVDEPIFEDGAAAYFSTLPIKRIVERVRAAVPNCKFVLLCDENSDAELARQVKCARQDRLIDAFLYASVTPTYLTAALDAL